MNETLRLASRMLTGVLLALVLGCGVTGCAHTGKDPEANDPYEKTNRAVFKCNMALDRTVMKPVAKGYKKALPDWTRSGIRAFLDNISMPITLVNDFLQGDFRAADVTFARFCE